MSLSLSTSKAVLSADSKMPRYRQIQEHILAQIADGTLKPGGQLPCQRKWAADIGVSYETMSKAVRDLVAKGVLDAAPRRGTVVAARGARGRVGAVGLVNPTPLIDVFRSRYYTTLLPILQDALMEEHERVVYEHWDSHQSLISMFDHLRLVDGIMLFGNRAYPVAQVKAVERVGIPAICVGGELDDPEVWMVRSDDVADVRNAVKQLAGMGYTAIGAWADSPQDPRVRGYMQGLKDSGLPFHPELLFLGHEAKVAETLTRPKMQVQAFVFLRHMDRVRNVVAELRNAGMRLGHDIYLCSYDDDLWRNLAPLGVPYAHIEQQTHELAQRAAQIMIDRIEGRQTGPVHTLLPSRFMSVSAPNATTTS